MPTATKKAAKTTPKAKTAESVELTLAPKVNSAVQPFQEGVDIVYPVIANNDGYVQAAERAKVFKGLMAEVDEGYDDLIAAAHKLHAGIISKKKVYYTPLKRVYDAIVRRIQEFATIQEQKRRDEERRLAEVARAAEQERLTAEAQQLESMGHREEAALVLEEAIQTPPPMVVAQSTVPQVAGVYSRNLPWQFEIVDAAKVKEEYWTPDMDAIAAVVKAKGDLADNLIGKGSIRVWRGTKPVIRG